MTVNNVAPTVTLHGSTRRSNEGETSTTDSRPPIRATTRSRSDATDCGAGGNEGERPAHVQPDRRRAASTARSRTGPARPQRHGDRLRRRRARQRPLAVTVNNVAPDGHALGASDARSTRADPTYTYTGHRPRQDTFTWTRQAAAPTARKVDGLSARPGHRLLPLHVPGRPASLVGLGDRYDGDGGNDARQPDGHGQQRRADGHLAGRGHGRRGPQHTYSFTTTDPGEDTSRSARPSCGPAAPRSARTTFNPRPGAGSFVCSFPDGPASPTSASRSATPTGPRTATRRGDGQQRRADGQP